MARDENEDKAVGTHLGYTIYEGEDGIYWDEGGYHETFEDCYEEIDDYVCGQIEEGYDYDGSPLRFADPGGNSSLRASGPDNPRIYSCPTCHTRQVLTRRDKELGYQCNSCADQQERGGY